MNEIADRLRRAGYERAGDHSVALSGAAAELYRQWATFLAERLAPYYSHYIQAPLFIEEDVLEKAGYLAHFPHQVLAAQSYSDAQAPRKCLTPAACLHLYPTLRGKDLSETPFVGFVVAQCARYEGGNWEFPFRVAGFNMAELVVVGAESTTGELYGEMQSLAPAMLGGLGFEVETRAATDAFFLGSSDGARLIQKLKKLKKEYTVRIGGEEVALASLNNHESYFSRRFAIGAPGGGGPPLHSFCLAFGLERLAACGLLLWGDDAKGWPEDMRP